MVHSPWQIAMLLQRRSILRWARPFGATAAHRSRERSAETRCSEDKGSGRNHSMEEQYMASLSPYLSVFAAQAADGRSQGTGTNRREKLAGPLYPRSGSSPASSTIAIDAEAHRPRCLLTAVVILTGPCLANVKSRASQDPRNQLQLQFRLRTETRCL